MKEKTQEKLPNCNKQSYYEGEFQNGEITGKGVYVYSNGNVYKGEFLEGEKHGQGVFNTDYEQYTGEFQYNQYHGDGIIKKSNGDVIEGQFKNHKPHGNCEINIISKQEKYIGQMQNGLKHGEGEYTIPNYSYKGNFENDKKMER
ncbi:hypothetical protein PPERSA_01995 [Pseudocohnilembus persalinus]|uniref:MORN motif n=1 Tax=Pseudocohnilembus persalinus TaxID=266149 RepID=A0A0V0QFC1_PSEPJ|nr:hypothetical protein PPERSA_01995 [Pseudocohnilembus persalinus]|eukprot:KRX00816.1 hypothetical protein PPERSA_01995 [Pseudocohnilembus persalinus]